jgi:hypothetical protein
MNWTSSVGTVLLTCLVDRVLEGRRVFVCPFEGNGVCFAVTRAQLTGTVSGSIQ